MRTFTIEPHPNAEFISCKNLMVLRSNDGKIHAHSTSKRKLRKVQKALTTIR